MDSTIGTPFTKSATKVLLCGSGELGKEVVIELQRFGVEVIALDAYGNAPAMQVADRAHVVSMLDGASLREIILHENQIWWCRKWRQLPPMYWRNWKLRGRDHDYSYCPSHSTYNES